MDVRRVVGDWRYMPGAYEHLFHEVYAWDHASGRGTVVVSQWEPGEPWDAELRDDRGIHDLTGTELETRREALEEAYGYMLANSAPNDVDEFLSETFGDGWTWS